MELELELIQSLMAQKPVLRGEVGGGGFGNINCYVDGFVLGPPPNKSPSYYISSLSELLTGGGLDKQ